MLVADTAEIGTKYKFTAFSRDYGWGHLQANRGVGKLTFDKVHCHSSDCQRHIFQSTLIVGSVLALFSAALSIDIKNTTHPNVIVSGQALVLVAVITSISGAILAHLLPNSEVAEPHAQGGNPLGVVVVALLIAIGASSLCVGAILLVCGM